MKTYSLATALALGIIGVDAELHSYSRKVVGDTKNRLEQIHGKGLVGLYDDKGKFQAQHLKRDKRLRNVTWNTVGGIRFDTSTSLAGLLGFVNGTQFSLLSSNSVDVQSNCFYAAYAWGGSLAEIGYDMSHFFDAEKGEMQWFNVVAYQPTHILGNASVIWETCQGEAYVNLFKNMAGLDYAQMAQTLSTDVTYLMTDFKKEAEKMDLAKCKGDLKSKAESISSGADVTDSFDDMPCDIDLYAWGESFGRMISHMTVGQMETGV